MTALTAVTSQLSLLLDDDLPDEAELAAAAFLARYQRRTLEAYRHDLRSLHGHHGAELCAVIADNRSPVHPHETLRALLRGDDHPGIPHDLARQRPKQRDLLHGHRRCLTRAVEVVVICPLFGCQGLLKSAMEAPGGFVEQREHPVGVADDHTHLHDVQQRTEQFVLFRQTLLRCSSLPDFVVVHDDAHGLWRRGLLGGDRPRVAPLPLGVT